MNDLEQDIELVGYGVVNSKTEDDILASRVNANSLKEEFVVRIEMDLRLTFFAMLHLSCEFFDFRN